MPYFYTDKKSFAFKEYIGRDDGNIYWKVGERNYFRDSGLRGCMRLKGKLPTFWHFYEIK